MSLRAKAYIDFENIYYAFFPPKAYGRPDELYHSKGEEGEKELRTRYRRVIDLLREKIDSILKEVREESENCNLAVIEVFSDFEEFIGAQSVLDDAGFRPTYVRKYDKDFGVRNNAVDMKMSNTITTEVSDYDMFILAMADKDYKDAIDTLRENLKKIAIIGIEDVTPQRLLIRVPYYRAIKHDELKLPKAIPRAAPIELPPENFLYRALMLRAHRLMTENRWPMVHINKLVEEISKHKWFKDLTKPDWYDWINQARDEKILIPYRQVKDTKTVTFFTPNYASYLWQDMFYKLDRIVSAIEEALRFEKWKEQNWGPISVVVKSLEYRTGDDLADHPTVYKDQEEGERARLIKRDINLWLRLFTEEEILSVEVRENPDPKKPPTTGFLPPLSRGSWLTEKIPLSDKLQQAALILTVKSFMEQNNTDWIAVGQLEKILAKLYGPRHANEAISWGERNNILQGDEVEYQGNRIRAYHLSQEDALTQEIIDRKEHILNIVKNSLVDREARGLDLDVLIEKLKQEGISDDEREIYSWIAILRNGRWLWTDLFGKIVNLYRQS